MNHLSILSVIRVNPLYLEDQAQDIQTFSREGLVGLRYEIPTIRILGLGSKGAQKFIERPLLISYGFIRIPNTVARNPVRLNQILSLSRLIRGFFYKKEEELMQEELRFRDRSTGPFRPVLIKGIREEELVKLFETSDRIGVQHIIDDICIGDFIVLKGYPFDGLSAKVVGKRSNKKIQVQLLSSEMVAWVDSSSLYYSTPDIEDCL